MHLLKITSQLHQEYGQAVYELPSCLSVVNATGTIECPGYAGSAGTYEIKNGVVTFVYEEAFLKAHPSDIKGTFNFDRSTFELCH